VLPGFRRWQANREVSGHEHRWSGACGQAGSVKIYRHTRSPYVRGHAWQRSRDQLLQPGHRRLPARRRPPRGRRRRGALQPASSTQGLPGLGDRLLLAVGFLPAEISHSGTNLADRGFGALLRHPGGAAQSGPRAPGRAAGPAAAWPRYRPAAQPEGGSLLGTHQERRPVPGTGPAGEVRHRRPPRAARPYLVAARQLSATGRSTRAAPNCCSRSSPGGTNTPRSGSGPTFRSGEWGSVFGDQRLVAQSLTGSPSTRTSSRPAPGPADCAPAASAA
jgi:hypothetical protein